MKERPILFSGAMVRAILDGIKTQTRRIIKRPSQTLIEFDGENHYFQNGYGDHPLLITACPYGDIGERLWVRETFYPVYPQDPNYNDGEPIEYDYKATYNFGRMSDALGIKKQWRPSIHMPRLASRITLEITNIRVERLNDISEIDAQSEGCNIECMRPTGDDNGSAIWGPNGFCALWESINGAGSWALNPWVWVIEFKRV